MSKFGPTRNSSRTCALFQDRIAPFLSISVCLNLLGAVRLLLHMPTRYDVVLWGGSGFAGSLVARYIATHAQKRAPGLRWAIAGRQADKLESLVSSLPCNQKPPILIADAMIQSEVDAVVKTARVVLSTAGPYALHGTPVVDACVRLGCDYVRSQIYALRPPPSLARRPSSLVDVGRYQRRARVAQADDRYL